jgi:RNA polymerase sigma factor for flagellar operon FliA
MTPNEEQSVEMQDKPELEQDQQQDSLKDVPQTEVEQEKTADLAEEFLSDPAAADVQKAGKQKTSEDTKRQSSRPNTILQGEALKVYGRQVRKGREDKLIVEHLPLVHKIVHQVVSYLRPPLTIDDLVSAGTIGLVKAARDFDPSKDAEFKTYAYIRVRGAVIDELRSWSFAPASLKKQLDQAKAAFDELTEQNGVEPTDEQVADEMGIKVNKLYKLFENARARHFLSMNTSSEDEEPTLGAMLAGDSEKPGDNIEQKELLNALAEAIQSLPSKERKIIILYYNKELTMKEVATVLNVTESRISQMHASALFKLSNKLRKWDDSR